MHTFSADGDMETGGEGGSRSLVKASAVKDSKVTLYADHHQELRQGPDMEAFSIAKSAC